MSTQRRGPAGRRRLLDVHRRDGDDGPADARRRAVGRRPPVLDGGQRRRARSARAAGRRGRRAGRGPPHEPAAAGRHQVHHDLRHRARRPGTRGALRRARSRSATTPPTATRRRSRHDRLHGSDLRLRGSQRCIVSIGTAGGVKKRVIQRVVSSTGQDPFPVPGIVGKDFIKMKNNNDVGGGVGTNGQLELGNNSTITGSVQLWQSAPNPIGYSGTVQRNPQPFVLSPPNMLNPTDAAPTPRRATTTAACSRAQAPPTAARTAPAPATRAATRTLTLGNNDSVTLGGAVYNFCQINVGPEQLDQHRDRRNDADLPRLAGSRRLGMPGGHGRHLTGNGATLSNPSQDPTKLQIVIYGQAPAWPTIELPNNITVYGSIYAPNTGPAVQEQRQPRRRDHGPEHRVQEQLVHLGRARGPRSLRNDARLLPRRLASVQRPRVEHHYAGDRLPVVRRQEGAG